MRRPLLLVVASVSLALLIVNVARGEGGEIELTGGGEIEIKASMSQLSGIQPKESTSPHGLKRELGVLQAKLQRQAELIKSFKPEGVISVTGEVPKLAPAHAASHKISAVSLHITHANCL